MHRLLTLLAVAALACGASRRPELRDEDPLAARFPLARLDDRALCDQLLARSAADFRVTVDREPRARRKVIISDLHLGPGTTDARFAGIEDFFAEPELTAFLAHQAAAGPTDLVIAGDFIDFWQVAAGLGALPKRGDASQPASGTVLAADQQLSLAAVELVIAAHRDVFRDLGGWIASGDHRVIILAGNHDADLLWPRVQLAIARAIAPNDPARLVFVDSTAYEHAGVHIEHGHAYDAANRFATTHAPFGRDRNGRCRLQSSWGEVFVDQFYTETERQIPFIDNLYPESAAILWALRDDPRPARDLGAAVRFFDLVRVAETKQLNRNALGSLLQSVTGMPGSDDRGPSSIHDVIEQLSNRLVDGDPNVESIASALLRFRYDPDLAQLWSGIVRAAVELPNVRAAFAALRSIDAGAVAHLRDELFGESMTSAAQRILRDRSDLQIVVLGHTHRVGGSLERIKARGRTAFYVNTGSWISVASVAELRGRGVSWDQLSLADRKTFPSKTTAVIVEYDGTTPREPVLWNAPPR